MTVIDWQTEVDKRKNQPPAASAEKEIIPGVPAESSAFLPSKPLEVEARAREIVAEIFNRALIKSPAGQMTQLPSRKRD